MLRMTIAMKIHTMTTRADLIRLRVGQPVQNPKFSFGG
jgi:hypothetical protein